MEARTGLIPTEVVMGDTRRKIQLGCQGCGWTVTLPYTDDNNVSIEPVKGWEIAPDEHTVLCERCATGWRPTMGMRRVFIVIDHDEDGTQTMVAEDCATGERIAWPGPNFYVANPAQPGDVSGAGES